MKKNWKCKIFFFVLVIFGFSAFSLGAADAWLLISPFYMTENITGEDVFWVDDNNDRDLDIGETVINTEELLGWNFGGKAELGFALGGGAGIVIGYTGRFGNAETQHSDPDENLEPLFGNGTDNSFVNTDLEDFEQAGDVIMTYDTQLHGFELSLFVYLTQAPNYYVRGRIGPKVFWIKDAMYFDGYDNNFADKDNRCDLNVDVTNWMYGGQAGFDLWYEMTPGISFEANLYGGIYSLNAEQVLDFYEYDGDNDAWTFTNKETGVGFFGDARGSLIFHFTPQVGLRLGYHLVYLSKVARSLNQIYVGMELEEEFEFNDTLPETVIIGSSLFHGATISLIFGF